MSQDEPAARDETPRLLLVDDLESNLVALEAALADSGCELRRATSGNEALRLLLRHSFAAMLLDVQMPEMDGYEVARLARDNPRTRDVPILFLTAQHQPANVLRGYGSGAVDYLLKPVDVHILRSKIRVFVELYRNRRRLEVEIEARTRLAAALAEKNAALAAANNELEAFSYSVSHDLRAPLRTIDGFSAALAEECGTALDVSGQDYLRRVRASVKQMGDLIEDLLKLSRLTSAELHREPVDLAELAQEISRELAAREPGRKVEWIIKGPLVVDADPGLARVLLANLLGNAWKFSRGCALGRIEVGATEVAGRRVYFVRDNGAGFDMAYAAKLFRPFQRLHDAGEFEGTGIGLATVQRIVQRHGGSVWAEGAPQQGATVYFVFASTLN